MNQYNPHDRYFKKAKEEGYRARSIYKLEEIQHRYHILKPGQKVLDLGSAPGSFLQYISKVVGEKGIVVGIDLQPIKPFKKANICIYQGDINDEKLMNKVIDDLKLFQFDVITSDLAPKTSGIKFLDGGVSLSLNIQVLAIAKKYLKKGGSVIMKILPGFNEGDLVGEGRKLFKQVKKHRPHAVRGTSGESYIIGLIKL